MRLLSTIGLCAALTALAAASVGAASAPSPEPSAGKALFLRNGCEQCHGTVGQGNRSAGPKLAPHPLPYAAFLAQLRKPRAEMPPYSATLISDADVAKIHAYLALVPDGKTAAAIPMLAGVRTGGAATAAAAPPKGSAPGRAIFAQRCAACHGTAGAGGAGPALTGERARKNLAATIAIIKHPTGAMPALYPSPLSEGDVANVAAYVQSL